jgi:hypothetical protein
VSLLLEILHPASPLTSCPDGLSPPCTQLSPAPVNFSSGGLRIGQPYLGYSNCVYSPTCVNLTLAYGTVARCESRNASPGY